MKKSIRWRLCTAAAVLLIAAAELAVLFAYFLPFPFPVHPLRFRGEAVTEVLLRYEPSGGFGEVA